jgi:hypothetical protein
MRSDAMANGTQKWVWALLPALLVLGGAAQAQQYDRYRDDGYNDGPVRCESIKGRTQQCPIQGRARLVRQISGSPCIEGDTWGQARNGVWVTKGCRAEFIAEGRRPSHGGGGWGGNGGGNNGGGWGGGGQVISCDSNDQRLRRCNVSIRRDARLVRQTSRTACVEGRTWGFDRDGVWVNGGCRGQFEVR